MSDTTKDPLGAHAELIGHVSMAWTSVQYVVFLLFRKLTGLPVKKAEAIFFTLKADTAQRDITRRVAMTALQSHPELLAKLTTTINAVGSLAGERNAATHTMWSIQAPANVVTPIPGAPKHPKLQDDFTAQFQKLERELRKHAVTLVDLLGALPQPSSSPDRPPPQEPPPQTTPEENDPPKRSRSRRSPKRSSRK